MSKSEFNDLIRRFEARDAAEISSIQAVLQRLANEGAERAALKENRGAVLSEGARRLASIIDHTALKPDTRAADVERLCDEAIRYGFAAVCVNPCYAALASAVLDGKGPAVCTVAGFPLGGSRPEVKAEEAVLALEDGAAEIDMVINVGMVKSGELDYVEADIRAVVDVVRQVGGITKVILETALLTDEEKVTACLLARAAGADFVKTSTGFASGGATAADVALMRHVVGDDVRIKASGGIRSSADAQAMIESGATRIGASASVRIVEG